MSAVGEKTGLSVDDLKQGTNGFGQHTLCTRLSPTFLFSSLLLKSSILSNLLSVDLVQMGMKDCFFLFLASLPGYYTGSFSSFNVLTAFGLLM